MKYPKEYLEEIKLRLKVSQVVGKTVQLKKRGKEFVGLSPFKNEKTPSFTVSDEKGFYHCFSSGEHGNIFDFLMKTKSVGFGEAVKTLASEAGMEPFRFSKFDEKKEKRYQIYKNIYNDYVNFFHDQLFLNESVEAQKYLEDRKISKSTLKNFKIGFVPRQNNFYNNLLKKYSSEDIELTKIYYKNDKTGKFIDRFNSRIIFPINNLNGDPIAIGGRIIKKELKLAKYINSPETEFYKKGRVLFNLDKVKSLRSETKQVLIVEGYMDVLSLNSSGFRSVISNSGIALTENQISLIWKFFSDPIICLDGDDSGQRAALRIAERLITLINEDNKIYFSILPKGQDPDDFVKKNGKESFLSFLDSKKIIQHYIWEMYSSEIKKNDPYAISKFEKKIKSLCYTIKDEVLKKYILEEFLEKIRNLTPIQSNRKNFNRFKNKNFSVLQETRNLHKQSDNLTKEQLKEFSILFIMVNYSLTAQYHIEELSELKFSSEESENLKNEIIKKFSENLDPAETKSIIKNNFKDQIDLIEKNSNIKNIIFKKSEKERENLLKELIEELKEIIHLKKIEYLESKVAKNLDEGLYSELIKLKSQLNRD